MGYGLESPRIAAPIARVFVTPPGEKESELVDSPIAAHNLLAASTIISVGDQDVHDWRTIRQAAVDATAQSFANELGATLAMTIQHPTPGAETESIALELSAGSGCRTSRPWMGKHGVCSPV